MKTVILGAGRVGGAIAVDLARGGEFQVLVADRTEKALAPLEGVSGIKTAVADLSAADRVRALVEDQDIVVGAVPGAMGFGVVRTALEVGKPVVDISFFPEDPYDLDEVARRQKVPCLVDFGVAPGCSTLFYGHLTTRWRRVESYVCYVGGLPVERRWPWQYKAPFSPADVLELYTRPARYVVGGKQVVRPPLTEPELLDFDGVGTLEAFLTDGLRTLLRVEGADTMVEKTMRYPGHREQVKALADTGFLGTEPVELADGTVVRPRALAEHLLFPAWHQAPGDEDITVMRIDAHGEDRDGARVGERWDLLDRYDRDTDTTSMARTTGFTCTAGVRLLSRGLWRAPGVVPAEHVGANEECFRFVLAELDQRGVVFKRSQL
jgi:saccharopine dehydrogenase-like NADP-dependent oxidoreductase